MSRLVDRAGLDRVPRVATCGLTRLVLHGAESGGIELPPVMERHRSGCLSCQAATARQRRMLSELGALRTEVEPVPYDMTAGLEYPVEVDADHPSAPRRSSRRTTTAVASAVSIAAIGVVVLARRMRSPNIRKPA
ncbi:hypothetical protein [Candidatus Spongiisocius sp.]|uniref:hypothetical protein n=1 Tax=Candidatus Spongiisocius sp. TaxID=3101273 RepID=UPI003B58BE73